jgi:hypothetical protein
VVALVEDQAAGQRPFLARATGGLDQDKGVVGDHRPGVAGAPDAALDEALAVVRASRIDAFAAAVGEALRAPAPGQLGQPAGEIAAGHVAVAAARRPAGHEPHGHGIGRARREAVHRLLEVQQAEIVLAALADDHLLGLLAGLRVEPAQLVVDLVLQVAGVGGDPDRALVLLGPEAGRGDVAQGLAHPGAGLGQDQDGAVVPVAGLEGLGQGRGVVGLLRARLGVVAQQIGQAGAGLGRVDRAIAGPPRRRQLLPVGQPLPGRQPAAAVAPRRGTVGRAQGAQQRRAPAPAVARHDPGDLDCRAVVPGQPRGRLVQQPLGGEPQGPRRGLRPRGRRQAEGARQAARRRRAEGRRAHEGEELQEVEGREGIAAQAARRRRGMADHGRGQTCAPGGLDPVEGLRRAVLAQPGGAAVAGHQHRRLDPAARGLRRRRGLRLRLEGRGGHDRASITMPAGPGHGPRAYLREIARRKGSDGKAGSHLASWAIEAPRAYASEAPNSWLGRSDGRARRLRGKQKGQARASDRPGADRDWYAARGRCKEGGMGAGGSGAESAD